MARTQSSSKRSERGSSALALGLFALGSLWGLVVASSFVVGSGPRPERAGDAAAFFFLSLFVGACHGGVLALLGGVLERALEGRKAGRRLPWLLGLPIAALYSWLALSLAKIARVGSPLRYEDLWFLLRGSGQLGGESTAAEKTQLALVVLLPLALWLGSALWLRLCARRRTTFSLREASLVALLSLLGGGALCATRTEVARLATVRLPILAAMKGGGPTADRLDVAGSAARTIGTYAARAPEGPRNVLVLMLESIPWKRLHGPEARPGSTPRLDALARQSVVFDRAYATSTHSDYAQTSILASLHPRKFEGHDYFHDLSYPRTLFWDPLVPLGYRSAVFSCQNERWGNMIAFLSTPNLQLLRHAPDWPEAEHRGDGSESKVFEETPIAAFFQWLDEEPGRPFAVYLNFQATHYPYVVPAGWPVPFEPSAIDFPTTFLSYPLDKIPVMENRFHNALAYVDESVGRVVDGLAARGLLDRTALLVVSDHGEAFYEHGLPTHGTTLLEEQVRTAMLLRLPGVTPARIEQPVSVLDAIPTIYRWMGLPRHGNFQGRDDVLGAGYSAIGRALPMTIQGMTREDGLLLDGWKYLVNWDRREKALFDLASDPDERRNLAAARPEDLQRLDASLRDLLGRQLGYYRARGWEQGYYPPPLP